MKIELTEDVYSQDSAEYAAKRLKFDIIKSFILDVMYIGWFSFFLKLVGKRMK